MLHITNGDSAAGLIHAAGMSGPILPWRDVLHEGPVPAKLDLEALSTVRARFLADRGWGTLPTLRDDFARRDAELQRFHDHDEVLLWFEHDLYDQLQIAQILAWFAGQNLDDTVLSMICIDSHPDVPHFRGLGDLTPEQLASLFPARRTVSRAQLALAEAVWQAFRNPDPTAIEHLLATDTTALPYMDAALRRHLQQFPSVYNGLGRTEHHALQTVAAGTHDPVALLRAHWAQEESPFLGDWTFWEALLGLADVSHPLLQLNAPLDRTSFPHVTLALTDEGRQVLHGARDFIQRNGIDYWLGGVHLHGTEPTWRWDTTAGYLRRV